MAFIVGLIVFVIYFCSLIAASGYTLSTLWNDFIPQIFPALPMLNFYQALAVSLVVGLFTASSGTPFKNEEKLSGWEHFGNIVAPFMRYGMALLIGAWIKTHLG